MSRTQARYQYRHPKETLEFFTILRTSKKKAFVITVVEQAGFEFAAESDINANAKDQPTEEDIVWRLPPGFATSADHPELKAEVEAIGESNRMTLMFRKPK